MIVRFYFAEEMHKSMFKYLFRNYSLGCDDGFFGPICMQKCPYPTYGRECQKICKCDNETCDHTHGCTGMHHINPFLFFSHRNINQKYISIFYSELTQENS